MRVGTERGRHHTRAELSCVEDEDRGELSVHARARRARRVWVCRVPCDMLMHMAVR